MTTINSINNSSTPLNKVTITAPASGATLTIADGKTFTVSNSLTLAGADGKTFTVSKTMSFTAADDTGVYTLPTGTKTLVATDVATLSSLASIGTITTGVWNGTIIIGTYGGTGINNGTKTLTYLKNISFTAADDTGVYTLPTGTKTLLATDGAGTSLSGIPYTITGTANQVIASAGTGNITLSLPQSIATGSTVQFAAIELSHATQNTLTASAGILSIESVAIPTISSADTLSNKTLTAPKFADLGFIADANGNELIILDTVASAVNEITIANGATTANATITASGETNTGITITGKGTKGVAIGNAFSEKVVVIADAAGAVIDCSLGNVFTWTAAADRTAGTTTNAVSGQKMIINFLASGAGRTLTLPTAATGDFAFGSDITTLSQTASGKTDVIGCIYNTVVANRWAVVAVVKGY